MFKDKLQISRERAEFWYSIVILFAIPLLIVINTLLLTTAVRKSFDSELRKKADLANQLISTAVTPNLDDTSKVQDQLDAIQKQSPELKLISVSLPEGNSFRVIASTEQKLRDTEFKTLEYTIADNKKQSIALLKEPGGGERYWNVVTPVVTDSQTKAIIATDVSLQKADADLANVLLKSLVIVGVTVAIVVLLLLNHFKFVEYAMLFKKQKEVDQLKNDFLSVATHELKAPMTVIKGNIENLIDGVNGTVDDNAKQVLGSMFAETDRLNGLVNDLLNVSRIEQGRISYNNETLNVQEIIEPIVAKFQDNAKTKSLTLQYIKSDSPILIKVDQGRMIEIMTNLIDNAIKYSDKGTVSVTTAVVKDKANISVRDTGIGMSAKDRERLFSRFYRIKNENTKGIPGTGLGLWIIKQYIEHMEGTISVDSMEGSGTEFSLEFPINSHAGSKDNPPQITEGPSQG